jgi:hypothetical protein
VKIPKREKILLTEESDSWNAPVSNLENASRNKSFDFALTSSKDKYWGISGVFIWVGIPSFAWGLGGGVGTTRVETGLPKGESAGELPICFLGDLGGVKFCKNQFFSIFQEYQSSCRCNKCLKIGLFYLIFRFQRKSLKQIPLPGNENRCYGYLLVLIFFIRRIKRVALCGKPRKIHWKWNFMH